MARYTDLVEEARKLLKRSEKDAWKLAELTHEAVKVKGKTTTAWAQDIGKSQSTVDRWLKIHQRYPAPGNRPSFFDAMLEIDPRGGGSAETSKHLARERQAKSAINELPAEAAVRLVTQALRRPEVAERVVVDTQAQGALARAEHQISVPSRPRTAQREIADELSLSGWLFKARKALANALREAGTTRINKATKEDLLAEVDMVRTALDWFESYLTSGDKSWEDALAEWEAAAR